jgi:heptosyltransferase-1
MERILIVRLGHLGDVIHALPAAAALREALPAARIGWAIEDRWIELIEPENGRPDDSARPLVDQAYSLPATRRLFTPAAWRDLRRVLGDLRRAGYDAVVDLQGLFKSALLARATRSPVRVGFERPKERAVRWLYTNRVTPRRAHVVDQNLELVEALTGRKPGPARFEIPRVAAEETWCEGELGRRGLSAFVILSPGAGWGAKLWPADSYATLARTLWQEAGLACLVNVGPEQKELGEEVVAASAGRAQVIECGIARLVALTRRASLVVGGDTGPVHLAAALGVPVVALFGPTSPERNGPYGERSMTLRSAASRTSYTHTDRPDRGLQAITPREAAAAALRMLADFPPGRSGPAQSTRT